MVASSDLVSVAYKRESSLGEDPGSTGWQFLPIRSSSLQRNQGTASSQLITEDRSRSDVVRTSVSAAGPIASELIGTGASAEPHADLLESLITPNSTWNPPFAPITASTISLAVGGGVSDSGSNLGPISVGDWIRITGSTSNDGVYRVTVADASGLTLDQGALVTESAGASITISGLETITDGIAAKHSYHVEHKFANAKADGSDLFKLARGVVIGGAQLNADSDGIITLDFTLAGLTQTSSEASVAGTPTASPGTNSFSAVNDVDGVVIGGTTVAWNQFSMNGNGNAEPLPQGGSEQALDVRVGNLSFGGTINSYFQSVTYQQLSESFADTTLALKFLHKTSGEAWLFFFPSVKITAANSDVQGQNTVVDEVLSWEARRDGTAGYTVLIGKLAA